MIAGKIHVLAGKSLGFDIRCATVPQIIARHCMSHSQPSYNMCKIRAMFGLTVTSLLQKNDSYTVKLELLKQFTTEY